MRAPSQYRKASGSPLGLSSLLVDEIDRHLLSAFNWFVFRPGQARSPYAYARVGKNMLALHRVILGLRLGDALEVDHINGNGLDNRRSNLRVCSRLQNAKNRVLNANNRSGFKGVYKQGTTYRAQIITNGVKVCLGTHASPQEASEAYKRASLKFHGDFSKETTTC